MENNTQENWWSKGEEDQSENQGNAEEFNHESSVIVYNKSPLAASLPWLGILAFSTLLIQAQAPASGEGFFFANCFNLLIVIVLPLILISNEALGVESPLIPTNHTSGQVIVDSGRISNRNSASNMGTRTTSKSSREGRHLWIQMETMASRRPMKSDAIKSVVRMILSTASPIETHCRKGRL